MMLLAFILSASCPETKIVNHTDTWNRSDRATLNRAKTRCGEIYKDAPCVKVFIKKEDQLYNVVCGEAFNE